MESQSEKFCELLKKFDTAILVTASAEGMIGRPMAIAGVEEDCRLWFFTAKNTEKTGEIEHDSNVLVTCQRDHGTYLSLTGTAQLVDDRAKISELWKESFQVWFPEGKVDPRIVLVHVIPERGEFWDTSGTGKIDYLIQSLKAYATKTTPKVQEGEQHGRVDLR